MYNRELILPNTTSFFLLGARGTGKSYLLRQLLLANDKRSLFINLLDSKLLNRLMSNPSELVALVEAQPKELEWVIIDEVQKAPALLDSVHSLIESRGLKFALSGSSARKLKRDNANLLGGRAVMRNLFPLTSSELSQDFDLTSYLSWGGLPRIVTTGDIQTKVDLLDAYVSLYLQEEIIAEQIVRALPPFRRFLSIAGHANSLIINFSKLAKQIDTDTSSVIRYFHILEDTLLGRLLEPFETSVRKRIKQSPKFYLFDTGIARALQEQHSLPLSPQTYEYGRLFETFVINEIMAHSHYKNIRARFSYLRTKDDAEIDLVIERPGMGPLLLEIKSTTSVTSDDCVTVERFARDIKGAQAFVVSRDPTKRKYGNTNCIPWTELINELT